jgi:hypothetical protein
MTDAKGLFEVPDFLKPLLQPRSTTEPYHIEVPALKPTFFEYHPVARKVFYVANGTGIEIAAGVQNAHEARITVMLWGRGYIRARWEETERRRHEAEAKHYG